MKILVIGGTGHVGAEVVKELKRRDADVRVLVRKPDVKSLPGTEMVVGDLLDPVSIDKALQGVDKLAYERSAQRNVTPYVRFSTELPSRCLYPQASKNVFGRHLQS